MAQYTVEKVSQQPPREYDGNYGKVYYIKVQLKGHAKPVEIGKKSPDAIKVGDTVHGEIKPTEFPTDSFKAEKPAFQGGGGFKSTPRDDDRIVAQWAIGNAITFCGKEATLQDVEATAKNLFAMVERVKAGKAEAKPEPKGEFEFSDSDEPISLEDIPF